MNMLQKELRRRRLHFFGVVVPMIFLLSAFMFVPKSYAQTVIFTDDFDAYSDGGLAAQSSWVDLSAGVTDVSSVQSNSSPRSLVFPTTTTRQPGIDPVTLPSSGVVEYSLYFRATISGTVNDRLSLNGFRNTADGTNFSCSITAWSQTGALRLATSGQSTGNQTVEIGAFSTNTWTKSTIYVDIDNEFCYGSIDDGPLSTGVSFGDPVAGLPWEEDYIKIGGNTPTSNPVYVDNVEVSTSASLPTTEYLNLIRSGTGNVVVNTPVQLTASWGDIPFPPLYLYFYDDVENPDYYRIVNLFPLGNTGSRVFSHTFTAPGSYNATVSLGNQYCSTPTASGCVLRAADDQLAVSVLTQQQQQQAQENLLDSTFSASPIEVVVGGEVDFSYSLSTSFCVERGATVSGKRIFKGYSNDFAWKDSGTVLSGDVFGQITWVTTEKEPSGSDFYFPYIRVYCDDTYSYQVFLGGSLQKSKAQWVSVLSADDVRLWIPYTWANGGESQNFGAGTGTNFSSDKKVYTVGEPVKLKWVVNDSSINKIQIHTFSGGAILEFLDSSDLTTNRNHYASIAYSEPGEYFPYLRVCKDGSGTGCTLFSDYYIGGETYQIAENAIYVSDTPSQLWQNTLSGSQLPVFTSSGAVVGIDRSGIFGLNILQQFKGWGTTGIPVLDSILSFLLSSLQVLIWVAGYIWNFMVEKSFMISLFEGMFIPQPGTQMTLPSSVLGLPIDPEIAGTSFTISYYDGANGATMDTLVQAFIFVFYFIWALSLFGHHKKID